MDLPVAALFDHPSIEDLAAIVGLTIVGMPGDAEGIEEFEF